MRIAIPVLQGKLCTHFGHCPAFALIDVDPESRRIVSRQELTAPEHEPGVLPRWLAEHRVNTVIAGGMGQRARDIFTEKGIQVLVGAASRSPEELVNEYLQGSLLLGENVCDH